MDDSGIVDDPINTVVFFNDGSDKINNCSPVIDEKQIEEKLEWITG